MMSYFNIEFYFLLKLKENYINFIYEISDFITNMPEYCTPYCKFCILS